MTDAHEAKQATPHVLLLAELLDSRIPKSEREHAAKREIERLTAERDDLRRQFAEAEQRFDWLAERLEDVQIDDADPNDHYYDGEEDVPFPILWRRAIDAAIGALRHDPPQRAGPATSAPDCRLHGPVMGQESPA